MAPEPEPELEVELPEGVRIKFMIPQGHGFEIEDDDYGKKTFSHRSVVRFGRLKRVTTVRRARDKAKTN